MSGPDKNYVDSINYLDKGKKSFLDDFEKDMHVKQCNSSQMTTWLKVH